MPTITATNQRNQTFQIKQNETCPQKIVIKGYWHQSLCLCCKTKLASHKLAHYTGTGADREADLRDRLCQRHIKQLDALTKEDKTVSEIAGKLGLIVEETEEKKSNALTAIFLALLLVVVCLLLI